ncbi:hypothetical protein OC834_000028 [Tilletia horrida]|nr:hypothetical protein OC834_000028 [Tilletia horrida]
MVVVGEKKKDELGEVEDAELGLNLASDDDHHHHISNDKDDAGQSARCGPSTSTLTSSSPLIELSALPLPQQRRVLSWALDGRACWAIVAPSSTPAPAAVKQHLLSAIAGRVSSTSASTVQHAHALRQPGAIRLLTLTNRGPAQAAGAAGAAAEGAGGGGGGGGGTGGAFVDYSARYGAIRDTDQTTLFESILATHDVQTGSIARRAFMPDPLREQGTASTPSAHHLLKQDPDPRDVAKARRLRDRIAALGPYLNITPELLQRPLIALSNGQLTRAKILSALLPARDGSEPGPGQGQAKGVLELLILDLPYSGLDPPSRARLSALLAKVHAERAPRILLALREGDPLPEELVTHVLWIKATTETTAGEEGEGDAVEVKALTREQYEEEQRFLPSSSAAAKQREDVLPPPFFPDPASSSSGSLADLAQLSPSPDGSLQQVRANAQAGLGVGHADSEAYVEMRNVSVQYKGFHALKNVDLALRPGSRLILAGPNGSGKTTLLSLLLGDHPLSFSFPALHEVSAEGPNAESGALSLFAHPRSHRTNASPLLARHIGHTSPELFRAFPRQTDLERGGLSLGQAIGSGFEGVFVRRPLEVGGERERRVRALVRAFADLFRGAGRGSTAASASAVSSEDDLTRLIHDTPFATLSPGSQSLALLLRACVHNPRLLILDEPFAGMDSAQIERARVFIDRVLWAEPSSTSGATGARREDKAMVLISHYEQEWPATFGQLLRLDEGSVVERI